MEKKLLPLGIMKQCMMKLDSALTDMHEIGMSDALDDMDKENFQKAISLTRSIISMIINTSEREISEEDFTNEKVDMDEIDQYPESDVFDFMDDEM